MLSPKLAEDNVRPVGTTSGSWLQVRTTDNSNPEVASTNFGGWESPPDKRGGAKANDQGCSKEGQPMCRSVPQSDIPSSQEGWVVQTSSKPKTPEPVFAEGTLQDGELGDDKGPAERGRLDGLHRSQRCIPVCPNLGGPPEIPTVSMARQHL